ncbi:MAG TPA: prepilin-type N-terminal cleavage/methylation domain-containing protein [Candidatus Saccharimonadales bacterium]|nr:prepilin-type N-terminal cleavage/methylation domain-containing protein [Candidatus Saccharimonadales bacterium]
MRCYRRARSAEPAFTLVELLVVIAIVAILSSLLLPAITRSKGLGNLTKCASNERQMGIGMAGYVNDNQLFPGNNMQPGVSLTVALTNIALLTWFDALRPYTGQARGAPLYRCPGLKTRGWIPHSYAYNQNGAANLSGLWESGHLGLGECQDAQKWFQVAEYRVVNPSQMIALGDGYDERGVGTAGYSTVLTWMQGFQWGTDVDAQRARMATRQRHTGRFNVLFVDGHVEKLKPSRLFGQNDSALRRLNNDFQSHRELINWSLYPKVID